MFICNLPMKTSLRPMRVANYSSMFWRVDSWMDIMNQRQRTFVVGAVILLVRLHPMEGRHQNWSQSSNVSTICEVVSGVIAWCQEWRIMGSLWVQQSASLHFHRFFSVDGVLGRQYGGIGSNYGGILSKRNGESAVMGLCATPREESSPELKEGNLLNCLRA